MTDNSKAVRESAPPSVAHEFVPDPLSSTAMSPVLCAVCGKTRSCHSDEHECPGCGGDGWYVGHDDACDDAGDCVCSGVQVRCECQLSAPASQDAPEQTDE